MSVLSAYAHAQDESDHAIAQTQLDVLRLAVRRQVHDVYSHRIADLTSALEQSQRALTAANIAQTHAQPHAAVTDKCECASLTSRLRIALDDVAAAAALVDRFRQDVTATTARAAADNSKLRRDHEVANDRIRLMSGALATARSDIEKSRRRIGELTRVRDEAVAAAQCERERAAAIQTQYDATHNAYEQRVAHIIAAQRKAQPNGDTADAVQCARHEECAAFETRLIEAQRQTALMKSALDAETARHSETAGELVAVRQTLELVKRDYSERLHERDDVVLRQSALAAELFRVQSELTECRSEYDRAAQQLRTAKSKAAASETDTTNKTVSYEVYQRSRREVQTLIVELANIKFAQSGA